jgi:hypothetical protein
MTHARGQPSRTLLNREYPHQVIVPADSVAGKALDKVIAFHDQARVPIKTRSARCHGQIAGRTNLTLRVSSSMSANDQS